MLHKISQNGQRAKIAIPYCKIAKLTSAVFNDLILTHHYINNKIKYPIGDFYTNLIIAILSLTLPACYIN